MVSFLILALAITWIGFVIPSSMYDAASMNKNLRYELTIYLKIPLVLMFFVILKYFGSTQFYRQSMLSALVSRLAGFAFGIYLVHVLVLHALEKGVGGFSLTLHSFDPWFSLPLTASAVFLLSVLCVWLLKKIPLVHWILP
jgi:peptidoglycan/LPS O-acetylase OafA/YrhL